MNIYTCYNNFNSVICSVHINHNQLENLKYLLQKKVFCRKLSSEANASDFLENLQKLFSLLHWCLNLQQRRQMVTFNIFINPNAPSMYISAKIFQFYSVSDPHMCRSGYLLTENSGCGSHILRTSTQNIKINEIKSY